MVLIKRPDTLESFLGAADADGRGGEAGGKKDAKADGGGVRGGAGGGKEDGWLDEVAV